MGRAAGPKSAKKFRKQSEIVCRRGSLGDTDLGDESSDDIAADETSDGAIALLEGEARGAQNEREVFQTPDNDENATDYGLEFTTSRCVPPRCSTLNKSSSDKASHVAKPTPSNATLGSLASVKSKVEGNVRQNGRNDGQSAPKGSRVNKPERKSRKPDNPLQRDKRFLREMDALQKRDLIVPRLPFSRLVRELVHKNSTEVRKITSTAMEALQAAAEMYTTQRLQDAYLLALHCGRVTLQVKDMALINFLHLNST